MAAKKKWEDDGNELPKAPRGGFSVPIDYEAIKQEPWLVELNAKLSGNRFKLDSSIPGELRTLSEQRTVLPVVRNKEDMLDLQVQNAQCLARRDRVAEILVSYTAIKYSLDLLWDAAQAKALELPTFQRLTNQPAREAFMAAILGSVHEKRSKTNKVIAMASILIEHLNATDFALQRHAKFGEQQLSQRSA